MTFMQNTPLTTMQMREMMSSLAQDESKIAQIITERSSITAPEIQELFRQGEAKSPGYALDKGIVHEVCDFNIPPGAPIVNINVIQR